MGKRGSKGRGKAMDRCVVVDATSSPRSDGDTDASDGEWEWLERDATALQSQYFDLDTPALVRACLKRGFGKGLQKGNIG